MNDLAERLEEMAADYLARAKSAADAPIYAGIKHTVCGLMETEATLSQAATALRSQAEEIKRLREALGKRSYVLSGPHLSGYTLTLGFGTLADAQAAHDAVARFPAADAKP